MTGIAYLLLGVGAMIVLLVGVAACLWLVQVVLNAHEAGQNGS